MAAEIHILSGARKGEHIIIDEMEFRVGTDRQCNVCFDPNSDPSAKGRSVVLRHTVDGWFIQCTGVGEVLLNHAPIVRETRIRSGDLVRLSDRGPDFSICLVRHSADNRESIIAHPTSETGKREAGREAVHGATVKASAVPNDGQSAAGSFWLQLSAVYHRWNKSIWVGAVIVGVLLAILAVWCFRAPL